MKLSPTTLLYLGKGLIGAAAGAALTLCFQESFSFGEIAILCVLTGVVVGLI